MQPDRMLSSECSTPQRKNERCFVLMHNKRPGLLAHPRGLKREETRCPVGFWTQQTPIQKRWEVCRACQHYRVQSNRLRGGDYLTAEEASVVYATPTEFVNSQRTDIVAVTAISPKRHSLQRQQECIDSWQRFGLSVYARNTKEEIKTLKPHFPNVTFIADEEMCVGYAFPTQRISHLAKTAMEIDCPVLLINSDCQLRGPSDWLAFDEQNQFVGVRWNYDAGNPYSVAEFRWGLDAFSFTPRQAALLPDDFPYGIGHPMWDYAVPALMRSQGINLAVLHKPFLFHQDHPVNWCKDDWIRGEKWMRERIGVGTDWANSEFRDGLEPEWKYSVARWVKVADFENQRKG